jgi:hypothetical protein
LVGELGIDPQRLGVSDSELVALHAFGPPSSAAARSARDLVTASTTL